MKPKVRWLSWLVALAVTLGCALTLQLIAGCSGEAYIEKRRQQLLTMYPPGQTTRADVYERWGHNRKWDVSETCPASGWNSARDGAVRTRVLNSEQRTGKPVHRVESDLAPDGWSGGLCVCWFYYDEHDRIVDVEWQWHTD